MKRQLLLTAALAMIVAFGAAKQTNAQYGCSGQYGQYGGCPSTDTILIDKTVGKVVSTSSTSATIQYVDNLSPDDPKFKAGDTVYFQLKVKDTSNNVLNNVKVVDYVPNYLNPLEGPGTFDASSRQIVFYIPQLQPNEERLYTVKMQVASNDVLNSISEGICEVNKASVAGGTAYDEDTAQFCVEKQVLGVTQVPSTGPEAWLPTLLGSIAALGAGLALKRKFN